MHALIIEPLGLISLLLEEELRNLGFTSFDTASTQDAAVKAAQRNPPSLITTALRLAHGNGVDAVRAICSDGAIPTVFIVSSAAEAKAFVGDAPIVTKPISTTELRQAVRQAMKREQVDHLNNAGEDTPVVFSGHGKEADLREEMGTRADPADR